MAARGSSRRLAPVLFLWRSLSLALLASFIAILGVCPFSPFAFPFARFFSLALSAPLTATLGVSRRGPVAVSFARDGRLRLSQPLALPAFIRFGAGLAGVAAGAAADRLRFLPWFSSLTFRSACSTVYSM